jgi:hypothetical protein
MSRSAVIGSAADAFNAYGRNPVLLLPALALFLALALFRRASLVILPHLQTNLANVLWTFIAALLLLLLVALSLSLLLALAAEIARHKEPRMRDALRGMRSYFAQVFSILIIVRVTYALLLFAALGVGNFVRDVLELGNNLAFISAFSVILLGFAGGLLFFAFAPAACVFFNQSIWTSIRTSVSFVRANYLPILAASAIVSFLTFLNQSLLPELAAELLSTLVFLPLLALYLCLLLAGNRRKKQ